MGRLACLFLSTVFALFPPRVNAAPVEPQTDALPAASPLPSLPAPLEATLRAASESGWRLGRFHTGSNADSLAPGDGAAAIVTLTEGTRTRQWLVSIRAVEPSAKEQADFKAPPPLTLYCNTGTTLTFKNAYAFLDLSTRGPFAERGRPDKKPGEERRARTAVNSEHLMLGFDRACRAAIRLRENSTDGMGFSFKTSPFPPEDIPANRARADALGLTPDEERAFAGTIPALLGFFQIALTTPGVQEIMTEVLDIPFWSVVSRGGRVDPSLDFDAKNIQRLPDAGDSLRYVLPMTLHLNGKPALKLSFVVSSPKPPLLATAGIVAVFAGHPRKEDRRATIEIVSAVAGSREGAAARALP